MITVFALLGCGTPVPGAPGEPGASFPHPDGYETHGTEALADLSACVACHPLDASSKSGPGCQSCHAAYPHDADMVSGATHGAQWLADAKECVACHGREGARAPAEVAGAVCSSCHHTYPHAIDFLDGHGANVVARGGPGACVTCHPAGGGPEAGRCAECHAAYPHPETWRASQAHDRMVDDSCTTGCHATDGAKGPVCTSCHDLYPHPDAATWLRGHLVPVQVRGESACRTCHPAGQPRGPSVPVSCAASCHTGETQ